MKKVVRYSIHALIIAAMVVMIVLLIIAEKAG